MQFSRFIKSSLSTAEILKGGVKFGTHQLCNVETIQWNDIVTESNPTMELPGTNNSSLCKFKAS